MNKQFGLTMSQKIQWVLVMVLLLFTFSWISTYLTGMAGRFAFIPFGLVLGVITWFISAGWSYKLDLNEKQVTIRDTRRTITVPLDRVGMLVRNGGFPFPTLWLVLRNGEGGMEMPAKGVDPKVREMVETYQKRNPNKKVTIVSIPGGYLRSVAEFTSELKRLVPPLVVDERLAKKK